MIKNAIMLGVFLALSVCNCVASEKVVFSDNFAMPPINPAGIVPCANAVAPIPYGIATLYWAELISPGGKNLWLYVNGCWRSLALPTDAILASVQDAFSDPEHFQVIAWYDNTKIIGLVVRSPMTC
ncbi:MAG: hypothetical protein E4G89_03205 [Methanothrix sp.]|nr:MAG: hypothetical protein E4G89_03205 [Methanothrix sp.]